MMKHASIPAICFLLMIFCAKQGMPPGGPEDKLAPFILQTIPMTGDTLVDPNTVVEAWFSEAINPATAAEAVFITPYPGEDVSIRWGGRRVRIRFPEPLKADRTYVVTFGTGIKDFRGNPMESSFILAFSTGAVLDMGEIAGRVYTDGDASGIGVWAYPLADSVQYDPSLVSPEYIVQCDKDGSYRFSHVAPGTYRLLAVRDRLADRLYQPVEDEIGLTTQDAMLFREGRIRVDSLYFRMSVEDTVGPSLVRAMVSGPEYLQLSFDEPLSPYRSYSPDDVRITVGTDSTASADTTVILRVDRCFTDPLNEQVLHVLTDGMEPGMQYVATADSVTDAAGNGVDPEFGRATFSGTADPDTTHPVVLLVEPAPGANSVPLASRVRLVFDEPMDSTGFATGFSLTDTAGVTVPGRRSWPSPLEFLFQPSDSLDSKTTYRVGLHDSTATDRYGNAVRDTVYQFKALNADTLSEIAGRVADRMISGVGSIHVTVRQVGKDGDERSLVLVGPGDYRFRDMLPGDYVLEAFRDADGNGRYSTGSVFPFEPAERFIVYGDTIAVRSRWPNEGNDVELK